MPEVATFEGRDVTESDFFALLESEMAKLDQVTHDKAKRCLAVVDELEVKAPEVSKDPSKRDALDAEAKAIGNEYLSLEKYVNVNFLAFHKILKKHDKCLPIPCRRFYILRLSGQRWVKHDYSKVFVRLSHIHSLLRGDTLNNLDSGAAGQVLSLPHFLSFVPG